MKVEFKIQRFDPERDKAPRLETYTAELEETDRVLDGLHQIKWKEDGTLSFRRSCGHGVCGSDAMLINGRNRLACKVLVRDLDQPITVQPLKGLKVLKDLIVDMEPFFEKYRKIRPYLMNDAPPGPGERRQSPAERERFEDTTKCILCAACTTSCPSFWSDPDYAGPAAIVAAHRFLFDSRDRGEEERLGALEGADGVWRCRTIFNCTEACPKGIQVTRAIQEVKQLLVRRALGWGRRKTA